ncbi:MULTISPECIES: cobalamin adenosyltransferase [Anaerococcus]|uniref:cobalamin adenosyltransferase n=1 Tax=Anaerococcus TaxID=165779 RepID=UPI002431F6D4|nr:cobalamin adenosyltransferase [Anaerococcus vaginalis]MBS6921459.1 cobalamin adenosyltransferase [Anaerococcus vaginalis]MDU1707534.1 cobalamin adenosyltransferase [Anaerococcus vaginalis]MDU1762670.1 cobalamin adenosyltransferase [Anaerococcus vaginalis]
MLFITEDNLRYKYRKSPFDSYIIEKGSKLTPQARQFLLDFRIDIVDKTKAKNTKKKQNKLGDNPICKNLDEKKLDEEVSLIIKKIAFELKDFDHEFASYLNDLAIKIFKNEIIDLEKMNCKESEAIDIYMNMNLDNPYLKSFISIEEGIDKLNKIKEKNNEDLIDKIAIRLYIWFINISKGG